MSVQFEDIGEECCQPGRSGGCFLLSSCVKSLIHMCMLVQTYWACEGYFLKVGELVTVDITLKLHRSLCTKLLCHSWEWLQVHKFQYEFPPSMEGTTSSALVDKSLAVATVKGSLAKPITSVARANPSNPLTKFPFNLATKSDITSTMCAGNEMLLRCVGKCSILLVLKSDKKKKVQFDMEYANLFDKIWDIFCLCPVIPHLNHSDVCICHTESRHWPWSCCPVWVSSMSPPFCACCCGGKL